MAEYVPILAGHYLTLQASAVITAGQVVEVTGSGTVGPAGAASTKVVGVASRDAAVNDYVCVCGEGIQHAVAASAIAAGDSVQAAAGGRVAKGIDAPIGIAVTAAGAGADVQISWK